MDNGIASPFNQDSFQRAGIENDSRKVGKKEPQLVLESPDFHEFYAELSGITGYNTPAGSFIHIAFMSPSVTNYRGAMGEPSSSEVVMKKVGASYLAICDG